MIFGRKQAVPEVGQDVFTSDEEHVGDVTAVHDDALDVRGGTLDRQVHYRIPRSSIGKIEDQVLYLSLSLGQMLAQDWQQPAPESDNASPSIG